MSALGDRLRAEANIYCDDGEPHLGEVMERAAYLTDEHESALTKSAQGRGPHAAVVLRWAAGQMDHDSWCHYKSHSACCGWSEDDCDCHVSVLRRWADLAVRVER